MKVGFIAEPNSKGQIVIPKKIRDDLKIDKNTLLNIRVVDDGIYIHPITAVVTNAEEDQRNRVLLKALEKTRGAWADDKDFDKRQKEMRKREIAAAKRMKKAW